MALAKITVSRIIRIVAADEECNFRIQSIIALLPLGKKTGWVRNLGMALGQGLWPAGQRYAEGRWGVNFGENANELDPNIDLSTGHKLSCDGIVLAVRDAVSKKLTAVPAVASVEKVSRSNGLAHAGLLLNTTDGGEYILDWWMSLDVENPYVFPFKPWDADKKETGIKYSDFGGFP